MNYLFDTHSLSNEVLSKARGRNNFFVTEDVVNEWASTEEEKRKLRSSGIKILDTKIYHLEKLKELLLVHGGNFKLIRLYTGQGKADVLMLAHVLSERERDQETTLFPQSWTIITDDSELVAVAKQYGFAALSRGELVKQL